MDNARVPHGAADWSIAWFRELLTVFQLHIPWAEQPMAAALYLRTLTTPLCVRKEPSMTEFELQRHSCSFFGLEGV